MTAASKIFNGLFLRSEQCFKVYDRFGWRADAGCARRASGGRPPEVVDALLLSQDQVAVPGGVRQVHPIVEIVLLPLIVSVRETQVHNLAKPAQARNHGDGGLRVVLKPLPETLRAHARITGGRWQVRTEI
ncbi:hypothetical protein GS502_12045 [Rhodococcus hoagii]|nr:hypothetical protein [Prescottella equi]